jgi:hypothetical protein
LVTIDGYDCIGCNGQDTSKFGFRSLKSNLGKFALGDVSRQSLNAQKLSCAIELAPCGLLQPYLPTIWTKITPLE